MLELSGIARSTYYYYLKQKDKDKYESEKQDILQIYNANKGIYSNDWEEYADLTEQMKFLNKNIYSLIKFFDER